VGSTCSAKPGRSALHYLAGLGAGLFLETSRARKRPDARYARRVHPAPRIASISSPAVLVRSRHVVVSTSSACAWVHRRFSECPLPASCRSAWGIRGPLRSFKTLLAHNPSICREIRPHNDASASLGAPVDWCGSRPGRGTSPYCRERPFLYWGMIAHRFARDPPLPLCAY
jgi:hypothetical protein